jgi:hypothetical protein
MKLIDLTWRREPSGNWILLHKRRRMGRVVPDSKYPGMYRIALSGGRFSDMANLSWAKSLALDAAERDLAYEAANTPQKPQQKRGSFRSKSSAIRPNQPGAITVHATVTPPQEAV